MADPLVSVATPEVAPTVNAEAAKGADVKASVLSWLGTDSDNEQAKYIMEQLKGSNIMDALTELKDIERKIGPAKFGENRMQRLHDYMKVLSQFKDSRKELERLERG